jgi:predicted ATPase
VGLHILTGAPGTGKTAVLAELSSSFTIVPEPARRVLAVERAEGRPVSLPADADRFVALLLRRSIESYERTRGSNGVVLFDRGIPDCIAYALHLGADPEPSIRASEAYRYDDRVLMLTPWEEIYRTDDERTMTFDLVLAFHEALDRAYRDANYEVVEVPRASVTERDAFVRGVIGR